MTPTAPAHRTESRSVLHVGKTRALLLGSVLGLAGLVGLPDAVQVSSRAADQASPAKTPSTMPLDARALARQIDQEVQQRLDADKIAASPRADDAEFLRRVYLDVTGVIPSADQASAFLDSKDAEKRARLIDDLLASPEYGRHQADIWDGLLVQRSSDLKRLSVEPLTRWLEAGFNANKPWDRLVSELVTASGPQDENGAVTFFVANPTADKVTDKVCQLFLGVQLQCAQCHNHPFTGWKQTEYWGMATFFTKVRQNAAAKKAAKQGIAPAVSEEGKGKGKQAKLPESALKVPAKFLQAEEPKLDPAAPYRPVLAGWLTSADNPFFARAMVNRTWAQLFGRGLVNPVADMHDGNAPSHPRLLQTLTEQFKAHGFDLKFLVRTVCNSETYQRTSKPLAGNREDAVLFSHMAVKSLSPEQLYDSLALVSGAPAKAGKGARKAQQGKKGLAGGPRPAFVAFFQTDDGADPTEYQGGIPQALRLMNSPQFADSPALLGQLSRPGQTPAGLIEHLYLATLSRRPTDAENQRLLAYVGEQQGDTRKVAGDVLWALLNSSEFTLNH